MRVGFATGFLAALLSLPLASKDNTAADPPKKPDNTPQRILEEKDSNDILSLRKNPPSGDYRNLETQWANKTYPTIRQKLISLYKAEQEDNKAIAEGKLVEKDRRVKVCLTDFAGPGEEAEDMGKGPNIHVVKQFKEKQLDGSIKTHYVNEHWPINELTGGILPPETLRVRVQAFKGEKELYEPGAHNLYITSMPLIAWNMDISNSKTELLLAQQHLFGEQETHINNKGEKEKFNPINQVEVAISSPANCYSCHNISPKNSHAKHIFNEAGVRKAKVNYGAITQDWDFETPFEQQPGYKKYETWLEHRVKTGYTKRDNMINILRDIKNPRNFEIPLIVETLKDTKSIPWVDGDTEVQGYDAGRDGFTYREDKKEWEKAFFSHYNLQLSSTFIGQWWHRRDLEMIPTYRK